ncbi:helix-turn-helix domain-containing protein [Paenibacillus puldeungensis]|uniref:Helix-turn-helix domain-containing protein n=2 Tax=Paenibacillus puldeungensis TaxID=696536 RepID=A0ABW3S2Y4_9BACL
MTFQTRMLTATLFLSLFPAPLLGIVSSYLLIVSVQAEVDKNHQMILKQIEYQLNAFLSELKVSSLQISEDLIVRESFIKGISREQFQTTMSMIDTVKKYRSVARIPFSVTLLYPQHNQVYSTLNGPSSLRTLYYPSIVKAVSPQYTGITVITPNMYPNQKNLLIIKPVSVENPIDGIVVLQVDITKFYEYLNQVDIGSTGVFVIDGQGRIVLSPHSEDIGTRISSTSVLYPYWSNLDAISGSSHLDNEDYSVTTFKSVTNSWTYLAVTPSKELKLKAEQIKRWTWSIVAAVVFLWGGVVYISYRKMYSPIRRISLKLPVPPDKGADSITAIDSFMSAMSETNERLTSRLFEQQPLVQNSVILQLLNGNLTESELLERMRQVDLTIHGKWYYIGIVEVDALHEFMQMYWHEDRTSMMIELSTIIWKVCSESYTCLTVNPQPGQIVFLALSSRADVDSNEQIRKLGAEIREKTRDQFKFTATVAIASAVCGLQEIPHSYQKAQNLMNYRYLLGSDVTITCDDVEQSEKIQPEDRITAKWYKRILSSVSEGDITLAENQFKEMLETLPKHLPDFRMIQGMLTYFLEEVDQLMVEVQGHTLQELIGFNPYTELYEQNTLCLAQGWFNNTFFPAVKQHLDSLSKDKGHQIAEATMKYIHEHFDQDFSLQQIAGELGVSSSQLSRFFKQTMNVNFVDYVLYYRISKAKEWLVYSDMSIKEIADRLRYTTTQNFTRVFKQITGVPPGKYRSDFRLDARRAGGRENEAAR